MQCSQNVAGSEAATTHSLLSANPAVSYKNTDKVITKSILNENPLSFHKYLFTFLLAICTGNNHGHISSLCVKSKLSGISLSRLLAKVPSLKLGATSDFHAWCKRGPTLMVGAKVVHSPPSSIASSPSSSFT